VGNMTELYRIRLTQNLMEVKEVICPSCGEKIAKQVFLNDIVRQAEKRLKKSAQIRAKRNDLRRKLTEKKIDAFTFYKENRRLDYELGRTWGTELITPEFELSAFKICPRCEAEVTTTVKGEMLVRNEFENPPTIKDFEGLPLPNDKILLKMLYRMRGSSESARRVGIAKSLINLKAKLKPIPEEFTNLISDTTEAFKELEVSADVKEQVVEFFDDLRKWVIKRHDKFLQKFTRECKRLAERELSKEAVKNGTITVVKG